MRPQKSPRPLSTVSCQVSVFLKRKSSSVLDVDTMNASTEKVEAKVSLVAQPMESVTNKLSPPMPSPQYMPPPPGITYFFFLSI